MNALANEIVAEILDEDTSLPVTEALVWQAKEALILRRDTHLDSLVDKLREERVKPVVTAVINGSAPNFDAYDEAVLLGQADGYLILFERDDSVSWEQRLRWETQTVAGMRITLVGV